MELVPRVTLKGLMVLGSWTNKVPYWEANVWPVDSWEKRREIPVRVG